MITIGCSFTENFIPVTEAFLHHIWKHRLFNHNNLLTDEGEPVEIVNPGYHNTGAGPDFFNAQLIIGGTHWAGNVEIHIQSSDWNRHNHHLDEAYDTCVLHVVLDNDGVTRRMNGTQIPTVQLRGRYPDYLWNNFIQLIGRQDWIACQQQLKDVDEELWSTTIQRMLMERLHHRSQYILISLEGLKNDWEECFYQYLAHNFGFQVNSMPFEMLARSLPLKILRREGANPHAIESLLYGQAGLLEKDFNDSYPTELQMHYRHFQKKYSLTPIAASAWKFMRMRPVNFPTIRIAQFAEMIRSHPSLFSIARDSEDLENILPLLSVQANGYWSDHYLFDKLSTRSEKNMGIHSIENILINTIVPFIYAWGIFTGSESAREKALEFLFQIPAEDNSIIRKWSEMGVNIGNAGTSQALIQLKQLHCAEKKCLSCTIGSRIINTLS